MPSARHRLASLMGAAIIGVAALPVPRAVAAGFTVNSTLDEVDAVPGDGSCVSTPSGVCTLRAAIVEANALTGPDSIRVPAGTYILSVGVGTNRDLLITSDMTIVGANAKTTVIDGNTLFPVQFPAGNRVFNVAGGARLALSHVTVQGGGGESSLCGGGIRNVGTLSVDYVTVKNNFVENLTGSSGGGICTSGSLTVSNSTIVDNAAKLGGGIFNQGVLTITNTTISRNRTDGSASRGGGIYNDSTIGTVSIVNSTIAENRSLGTREGAGLYGGASLKNTIVASNGVTRPSIEENCTASSSGSFVSLGNNLDDDGSCGLTGPGDLPDTAPNLGPLADNGGETFTHDIRANSAAVDGGSNANCPATDQRGTLRPQDGDGNNSAICDIGSFELAASAPTPSPAPSPDAPPVSHAGGRSTSDDREDGTRKLTGEQRQQRQLTNRSNKDDISIEGDVAEIHLDESPPYILIGSEDGLVKVVLLCRDGCATTRVDDYVQADGEKQHELLFHADSLEVRRRR